jgi:hypothetical protein
MDSYDAMMLDMINAPGTATARLRRLPLEHFPAAGAGSRVARRYRLHEWPRQMTSERSYLADARSATRPAAPADEAARAARARLNPISK